MEVEQFIEYDSEAIDIDAVGVFLFFDHFGGDVLHRSAKGRAGGGLVYAPAEVADLGVVELVEQDVLEL